MSRALKVANEWLKRQAFNPGGWLPGRSPRKSYYPTADRRPISTVPSCHSLVCLDCGYTKKSSISFGQCPQCGGRMCPDIRSMRFSSELMSEVMRAKKSDLPVVFLGGDCTDNAWREALKKRFEGKLFFLDPYDENWDPKENIYGELAGMLVADKIVFYRGGDVSDREQKFLDAVPENYHEFDDLDKLASYLESCL